MTESIPRRRVIEVRPQWMTPEGQKQRARRIARVQARTLSASVGEAMISKQMVRRENEQVRDNGA